MDYFINKKPQKVRGFLFLLLLVLFISACKEKTTNYRDSKFYVDKVLYSEGRGCFEVLFNCLPESKDNTWQTFDINDKSLIENYDVTKADLAARKRVIQADEKMALKLSKEDMDAFDRISQKQFIKEQAENLEKEFPGFWRDVAKPVRYRWIKRAMSKGEKYGYVYNKPQGKVQVIRLCARIGLDFDLDPKWEAITQFVSLPKGGLRGYAGEAIKYIDFTIFEKDVSTAGTKFTDWSLRTALQYLPYPKRKLPSIND